MIKSCVSHSAAFLLDFFCQVNYSKCRPPHSSLELFEGRLDRNANETSTNNFSYHCNLSACMDMIQILYIFFIGWLVSFLGQLPLGTMSITSTQIAVQENFRNAWKYALGVAIVEIIYL